MALQPREKKMLKVLGVVAGVAAIALFFVYKPKKTEEPETATALVEETPAESDSSTGGSAPRSGGGSRGGGGGSRGGGGSSSSSEESGSISLVDLEQHNTPNDCWVVIDAEVYDISGFIEYYPEQSGTASQYCGTIGFEAGFLADSGNLKGSIKQVSSRVGKF